MYPVNPFLEWLYEKSIIIQEFILFKIFRLKKHDNNIGVHFFIPIRPFQLFGINLYFIRLNLIFPFFFSISIGIEGKKGLQFYIGLKVTQSECDKYREWDFMLSMAGRYNYLAYDEKWQHMGSL